MPPHCDSLDGPMVTAARRALENAEVAVILPYVHSDGEAEVRDAFDRVMKVRSLGLETREVADRWFFETVVRVLRAREGAPFTGLKPAGLDVGPAIPAADQVLEMGTADGLIELRRMTITRQAGHRLARVMELKAHAGEGVSAAREYVEAALRLQVWAHTLYRQAVSGPNAHNEGHEHD